MKEILPPSLLPYLQSVDNPFRLEIILSSREMSSRENTVSPFLLISESTPFEHLLEAKIISDAGSDVQRVFFLQQSDVYACVQEEIWPITNDDIDRRWQETFKSYSSQSGTGSSIPFVLAEQANNHRAFRPFHSLFYCVYKDSYFHPPCSQCGDLLHLCRDDTLLAASSLAPYTSSLKRYLYCPACLQAAGSTQFYAFSREGADPPAIKDRWALLNDFGNLILKSNSKDYFPCFTCPERTTCYGTNNQVMSRIVPYSFYPFYLLIFKAATLCAADFLALVSGASVETLRNNPSRKKTLGRLRCLEALEQQQPTPSYFLFGSDSEKSFLEILYLKLSFLGELIREILSGSDGAAYFDVPLSLDRVWVRTADQAGLLPQFWNFKLTILDIWTDLFREPHLSRYPPTYGHHILGSIWFYALLVNDRQSAEKVRAELDKYFSVFSEQGRQFSDITQTEDTGAVLGPENIFWNPQAKHIKKTGRILWCRSLDIGGALLAASIQPGRKWSADEFWQNYNALREDVKTELFGQVTAATRAEHPDDDTAISDILKRLLARWRSEIRPPEGPTFDREAETIILPGQQHAAPDLAETIILSPNHPKKEFVSSGLADDEEETLILPSQNRFARPSPEVESPDDEIIQETVILSPGNPALPPRAQWMDSGRGQGDLPETVVITPGARPADRAKSKSRTAVQNPSNQIFRQPDGEKIRPNAGVGKKEDLSQDDDILTETIILRPEKNKGPNNE